MKTLNKIDGMLSELYRLEKLLDNPNATILERRFDNPVYIERSLELRTELVAIKHELDTRLKTTEVA